MKTIFEDTDPEAERVQLEILRKAPVHKRLQIVASLTKTAMKMTWDNLAARYPDKAD
jgi:hypothetical protein